MSKDVDVAFWLDNRAFCQQPPVKDVVDFVIVNSKLHAEFDSFKKKEVDPSLSYVEVIPLVEFYLQQKNHLCTVTTTKFG